MISLVFPCVSKGESLLPSSNGYLLFSALSRACSGTVLEDVFHGGDRDKPFSLSRMEPGQEAERNGGNFRVPAAASCSFRISFARDDLGEFFAGLISGARLQIGRRAEFIAGKAFLPGEHPDSGCCSIESLLPAGVPPSVKLVFASPTGFKRGGKQFVFPLPELLFGSLLQKWHTWTGQEPPGKPGTCFAGITVNPYDLKTSAVLVRKGAVQRGCVGEAEYLLAQVDSETAWTAAFLANFAFFSGVGVKTSMGMGQVYCHKEKPHRKNNYLYREAFN